MLECVSHSSIQAFMQSRILSLPLEFAFAFVEERCHAVLLVLGGEAAAEDAVFVDDGFVGIHVPFGVDAELGCLDGEGCVGGDLVGQLHGFFHEFCLGIDGIDESDAEGLIGADGASGIDELFGHTHANEACQAYRAAESGDDAQTHFGLAELGVVAADADVASHGELAAAAEGEAVDGGDDGDMERLDLAEHSGTAAAEGLALRHVEGRHLADVGAGHETLLAVAGDDEAAVTVAVEVG